MYLKLFNEVCCYFNSLNSFFLQIKIMHYDGKINSLEQLWELHLNRCYYPLLNYLNLVDLSTSSFSLFWLANISLDGMGEFDTANKSSLPLLLSGSKDVAVLPCFGNTSSGISVSFSSSPARILSYYNQIELIHDFELQSKQYNCKSYNIFTGSP